MFRTLSAARTAWPSLAGRTWAHSIGKPIWNAWAAVRLEVFVQANRDKRAAVKLIRKLLKKQGIGPAEWVTDNYPAYGAALRDLQLKARHVRGKQANNRAESSHVAVRRREHKLQGFKSPRSAQRFLAMHAATYNTFNVSRHLTAARTHRLLRAEAFTAWRDAAALAA